MDKSQNHFVCSMNLRRENEPVHGAKRLMLHSRVGVITRMKKFQITKSNNFGNNDLTV